ncbi:MAG: hypothetical protein OEW48_11875 [Phycisphaerae bacterium]|nr:hypothetical protein [Phycisphaerae bacterium]
MTSGQAFSDRAKITRICTSKILVIVVSDLRLLVFIGRVYYVVYNLSAGFAGPRNVATYALNGLATSKIKGCED